MLTKKSLLRIVHFNECNGKNKFQNYQFKNINLTSTLN